MALQIHNHIAALVDSTASAPPTPNRTNSRTIHPSFRTTTNPTTSHHANLLVGEVAEAGPTSSCIIKICRSVLVGVVVQRTTERTGQVRFVASSLRRLHHGTRACCSWRTCLSASGSSRGQCRSISGDMHPPRRRLCGHAPGPILALLLLPAHECAAGRRKKPSISPKSSIRMNLGWMASFFELSWTCPTIWYGLVERRRAARTGPTSGQWPPPCRDGPEKGGKGPSGNHSRPRSVMQRQCFASSASSPFIGQFPNVLCASRPFVGLVLISLHEPRVPRTVVVWLTFIQKHTPYSLLFRWGPQDDLFDHV